MKKQILLKTKNSLLLEKLLKEFYDFTQEEVNSEVLNKFRYGIELEGYFSFGKTKVDYDKLRDEMLHEKLRSEMLSIPDVDSISHRTCPTLRKIFNSINKYLENKYNVRNFFQKIYYDASLDSELDKDDTFGLEFVTRILSFEEFSKKSISCMKSVIKIFDVKFDETCGFHISFSHPEFSDDPRRINWLKVYILSGLYESGMKYDRINSSYASEIIGHLNDELIMPSTFKLKKIAQKFSSGQRILVKIISIVYKLLNDEPLSYKDAVFLANRSRYYFNSELIQRKYNAINLKSYSDNKRIEIRLFGRNAPYDFEEVVKRTINVSLAAYFIGMSDSSKYNKLFYDTFYKLINDDNYKKYIGYSKEYNKTVTPQEFVQKVKELYNSGVLSNTAKKMLVNEIPEIFN